VLRFTLRPGQRLKEHASPGSPVYVVVVQGEGLFAGGDGREERLGPGSLAIFNAGEEHSVQALDRDLVFAAFLRGEPTARPGAVPGTLTS
jgi:quercetin dioxygenase-like cupin family protein